MGPRISTSVKPDSGKTKLETQIVILTDEQLKDFASTIVREVLASVKTPNEPVRRRVAEPEDEPENIIHFPPKGKEYVFGIRGIRNLFGVGTSTAQRYKNTFLQPAVLQCGRKIAVDVDMARELFRNYREE